MRYRGTNLKEEYTTIAIPKGKLHIEVESDQKRPYRDFRISRKATDIASRKHRTHCASQMFRDEIRGRRSPRGQEEAWTHYEIEGGTERHDEPRGREAP